MDRGNSAEKTCRLLQAALVLLLACMFATGCASTDADTTESGQTQATTTAEASGQTDADETEAEEPVEKAAATTLNLASVPTWSGTPYVQVLGNVPQFTEADKTRAQVGFEEYSPLDSLGRCGVASALVGAETMPAEERGSIGTVKPSGWHTVRYDGLVDGNYLYNRCHLLGYQLTGENANERNLITGTRYLNVEGMLPFEDEVADYVRRTGNHVLYRVTPVFEGDDLVASGVQMEAWSVEDAGTGVSFDVWCYNVQPKITIDYATGDSSLAEDSPVASTAGEEGQSGEDVATGAAMQGDVRAYVLNKNTKKLALLDQR